MSLRNEYRRERGAGPRWRGAVVVFAGACFALSLACGRDEGYVELNWQFVDANLDGLTYPEGDLDNTCGLPGVDAEGEALAYSLSVRLTIEREACELDCLVQEATFTCDRLRGSLTEVPGSAGENYKMTVSPVIAPHDDSPSFVPISACITGPGPQFRAVGPGRTVDLQVMQFIAYGMDLSASPKSAGFLDLVACKGG